MKKTGRLRAADEMSHYKVSAFTRELIDDVANDHFRLRSCRIFVSRSWSRSLDDIKNSPDRMRSVIRWVAIIAAIGTAIILLTLNLHAPDRALTALALWLPWYAGAAFFLVTHIGMVDEDSGLPRQRLYLANGLSFSRLALAPLVIWPCLQVPAIPAAGPVFASFLVALSLTDMIDGWIAHQQGLCTRLGRMLDVLADLALLTFLGTGLYLAGVIPGPLLLLLVVRYPLLLIAVLVMYFVHGPVPLRPTFIGRMTTFVTSIVLLVIALKTLLTISWPAPQAIDWLVRALYVLISINLIYLFRLTANWQQLKD